MADENNDGTAKSLVSRSFHIVGPIVAVLGTLLGYHDKLMLFARERCGPDVIVTAVPRPLLPEAVGRRTLLYEFQFTSKKCKLLNNDGDVEKLFSSDHSVRVSNCHCSGSKNGDLYILTIAVQNEGGQKAKGYILGISFSGKDYKNPDPGVRIVQASTDALGIDYLYQSAPCLQPPPCIREAKAEESNGDASAPKAATVSNLCRMTYEEIGLTRDLAIFKGDLEAHTFKTIDLVVAVPRDLDKFAILYNVECSNCSWLYQNEISGQVISLQR